MHDLLPQTIRDLAEAVGLDAAMAIARRWPGVRIKIPVRPRHGHQLVAVVGLEAAERLAYSLGGETVLIPRCAALTRAHRDAEIMARTDRGEGAATIALALGLSETTVWQVRRRMRSGAGADASQLDLFQAPEKTV